MTQAQYVEILKQTAQQAGVKLVMQDLVSRFPFFRLAIINPLAGFVVGYVVRTALLKTELGAFFWFIDLRTSAQGRAFEKAAMANFNAQQKGTADEKIQAEKQVIDSLRSLVKLTN